MLRKFDGQPPPKRDNRDRDEDKRHSKEYGALQGDSGKRLIPPEDVEEALHRPMHGRDLSVVRVPEQGRWHWTVGSPHGGRLAQGDARTRLEAERAAEDEATAVHPPTPDLLDRLLT